MCEFLMHVKTENSRKTELLRHRLIIPPAMRLFLLTLMIALLPLRGWMGDAMALERSAPEQQTQIVASAHDDCHSMQEHGGMHEAAPDSAHADDDCSSCNTCQICHSLAMATTLRPAQTAQVRLPQPSARARLHASADLSPGFKPPIVLA